jgi:hypothetical protein
MALPVRPRFSDFKKAASLQGNMEAVGLNPNEANTSDRNARFSLEDLRKFVLTGLPTSPGKWVTQPTVTVTVTDGKATVQVSAGTADFNGTQVTYQAYTQSNVALPGMGLQRLDAVAAKADGTYQYVSGTSSQNPVTPAIATGALLANYLLYNEAGGTTSTPTTTISVVDAVTDGDLNAVTSNAVFDALANKSDTTHTHTDLHSHTNKSVLDVIKSDGNGTQYLADDGTYKTVTSGTTGATTFTALTDTPNSYTANKWLKVKADATGLEWGDAPTVSVLNRTGNSISFDAPAYYNIGSPVSGALTINTAGAKAGVPVLLSCTDGATMPASVDLAGALKSGTNYVHMLYVSDTLQLAQVHGAVAAGTGTPSAVKLATPTDLAATPQSRTEIVLNWGANPNETGTQIQYSTDNSTWQALFTAGAGATTYAHTGLTLSTTYYYRIRKTANGSTYLDSDYSNSVQAKTMAYDPFEIESLGSAKLIQYNKDSADVNNLIVNTDTAAEWVATFGANFKQTTKAKQFYIEPAGILSDGVDDLMSATVTITEPIHIFMVLASEANVALNRILEGTGTNQWMLQQDGGSTTPAARVYTYSNSVGLGSTAFTLGQFVLVHAVINGASSSIQKNADTTTTGTLGAINSTALHLAARSSGTNPTKIRPRELVIGKVSQLTASDITKIRDELTRRYLV